MYILYICVVYTCIYIYVCVYTRCVHIYAAAAKSLQLFLTLCEPIDGSPPGSPDPWDSAGKNTGMGCHFLLQCMKVKSESKVAQSCLTLATPWTTAYQAPLSMGFSRQKYWSGVPLPSPIYSHNSLLMLISSQDPFSNFTKQKYY